MKNLLWGLFAFAALAHAQGTVTDIDGNTYDYLTYGTQQWTVENAAMETYRDGTQIPQVTDATQWSNLTTGAWCYYDNDPTKGKLYNWYAVEGIHDNDPNTPNKEFAPEGWHVPTDAEWTTLEGYLIANGYNYDGTTTGNKIAKSMASTTGWNNDTNIGAVGNDQSLNNSSGFNAIPKGYRHEDGVFTNEGITTSFWSSTESSSGYAWDYFLHKYNSNLGRNVNLKGDGFKLRFVQNSNTCSEVSINASSDNICFGGQVDLTASIVASTFSNWNTNEPNNNNGDEHVGMLVENAKWNDHRASNSNPDFLMESDTNLGVISGFNFLGEFEGHFYYQSTSNSTWTNANSTATSLGGYLLIINSQAENDFIAQTSNITVHGSWIGMYQDINHPDYSEPGGAWFWDDGTAVSMSSNPPTYTWSTGDTTANISVNLTETTEYWVDVTTNGVTCREYVTIDVTAPVAPTGDAQQTFCDTATIADLTVTGDNIQWYDAATGGNLLDSSTSLIDGQIVYATQTVNGCESTDRLEVTVSIQEITITASATEVCAGESVDLTVSSGLTAGTTACTSTELPENLQTGLVGYWPFCGNANDESGNGNNGTVNGATLTTDRFGNADSAYNFDGTDDFINRETNSFISNSFSFSLFVKPNSEENIYNQGFVGNTGNFTPNNCVIHPVHGAVFGDPSQNAGVGLYVGSNGIMIVEHSHNFIKVSLSHEVVINDWVNIFILYENKLPKLYINGEFIKSGVSDIRNVYASVGNDNTSYENYSNNGIGAGFNQPSQFFDGFVDDIIHWNRPLNPSEIQQLANSSTYTWSTGDNTANISVTPTETTEYWVDVTTNGVTCREYVTINVTASAAPIGDAQQTFCDTATVADLTATGDNIQWYDSATGGNLLDSTTALTDGQMVYASQTVNGCESTDRLEVTVSIQDITITASATEVCAGESVDLTVSSGLTAGTTACTSAELPTNLQTGLVGYWPFCGNANDESGNGNNGTVNGATLTSDRFGNTDSAYSFDGINDYITTPNITDVENIPQMTWSVWVELNEITDTSHIIDNSFPGQQYNRMKLSIGDYSCQQNSIRMSLETTNYEAARTDNTIFSNSLYHLAIVFNGQNSQQRLSIYVNGILTESIYVNNNTCEYVDMPNLTPINNELFYFGGNNLDSRVNGVIDDIAIWNRALTPSEIQQLANFSTYTWSTGDTSETISVTPTETTEYWVDVTNNGVTCREYVTINVTAPAAPTGPLTQAYCNAATVADLTAIGENIQWYDAAIGGNLLDSSTSLIDGQMVYASQTVNGCESTDRLEVRVSIQNITITASATEVCAGETINITAQSLGLLLDNKFCSKDEIPITLYDSLLGAWPFCGNPNDVSGNNFNGTINGGVSLGESRFGDVNDSYIFDGQPLTYISIGTHEVFDITQGSISISAWVNSIGPGGTRTIVSKANSPNNFISGTYHLNINTLNQIEYINTNSTNSNGWYSIASNPINLDGQWQHIIAISDIDNLKLKLFIDGQLVSEIDWEGTYKGGLQEFLIGSHFKTDFASQYMYNFNGSIDDVAIWNRVLNQHEVDYLSMTNTTTYTWSTGDTSETISVTPTETTEYWVDVTTNGVTCREYVTISVNDLPEAPTGETVNYFINCDSFSPTLNDAIATLTGDNIKFYDAAVGGNLLDPNSNIFDGQVVYASQTLDSCESSDRLEVQLNLYTLDTPTTAAPNNTVSFCNEQNLTILDLAPAQTATDRLWYETATSTIPIPETTPLVDGVTYYVSNYDVETGCESDRLAMTVEINNPEAPTGDAVQSFCDNVTVSDLSASGSNIQWYDAATGGNVLDPSSALSDGQLLYASQTQNGCESITRLEVNVEIDIIPAPILITTELEFCLAREATLADLEVDEQGFALEWYDSFSGGNMLPMDTLLEDGVSYYATLYDAISGCESLMRLEVVPTVIPCEVVIYNAISLNDNGINDYMVIENAEYFPDNSLEVYNRDGHLLYSQTQYGIGDNLFRGVANVSGIYGSTLSGDGPRLPTGSYLYVFKYFNPYEQQQYTLKGFLTINSN